MTAFQFDARNASDFAEITERIQAALRQMEADPEVPATKANLARLSGVHRNTLYKRALDAAVDGDPEKNWPYSKLFAIAESRKAPVDNEEISAEASTTEETLDELRTRLEKSRFVAAAWFQRSLRLKQERDEAQRHVELLLQQAEELKREVEIVRQKLKSQIGVLK